MPVHNADIAAIFDEIADLLEIQGANPFKVRAYRNASHTIQGLGHEARSLIEQGEDLTELPGIGKELAAKIEEIVKTGHCHALEKLHDELPAGLLELLKMPGLGPKKVHALYQQLHIQSMEQLIKAAQEQRLRTLDGFGPKTEAHILAAAETNRQAKKPFLHAFAADYAESLVKYLQNVKGVVRVTVAGSFRRDKETVGDLDILVTTEENSPLIERFVAYDEVREVVSEGTTRASVILRCGLQVDVRVVDDVCYGAALHYFTGSKAHNIAIRRLGQQDGLKINEYGVFRGEKRVAGDTEKSVFKAVHLPYIPPELREDRGEIEAARAGKLPRLVEIADLKGDLHTHTDLTDGHHSLAQMAEAARRNGLRYMAVTEHSRRLAMTGGLDEKRLLQRNEEIDRLNESLQGFTILKGIEVDILEDGSLDLPDSVLATLDLVLAAVHSHFSLPRDKQTKRILKAMDRPHFSILAHPSGRLIPDRKPYDVDMEKIISKAKERGCFLELDAQPVRLDLTDIHCQAAKAEGVLVSINSDAHSAQGFDLLRFGIKQARRGWLEKDDVLNTRSLKELRRLLRATM